MRREGTAASRISEAGSNHQPTEAEIAARAYEIFLARGASNGNDLDDWLEAERELTERDRNSHGLQSAVAR